MKIELTREEIEFLRRYRQLEEADRARIDERASETLHDSLKANFSLCEKGGDTMREYTIAEKARGELEIRSLSEKAQKAYNDFWPLTVWAFYTYGSQGAEVERFSVKFGNELLEYMDKGDLEEYLEALADDVNPIGAIEREAAEARRDDLTEIELTREEIEFLRRYRQLEEADRAIKATKNIAEDVEAAESAAIDNNYLAFGAAMERIRTNNRKIQEILVKESHTGRKS